MGDVGEGGDAEEEAASLSVYELDGADIWEGCKVFHEEMVAEALWMEPVVLFKMEVAANVIKEVPCVG